MLLVSVSLCIFNTGEGQMVRSGRHQETLIYSLWMAIWENLWRKGHIGKCLLYVIIYNIFANGQSCTPPQRHPEGLFPLQSLQISSVSPAGGTEHCHSLSARLLPLFHCWCFSSLPHVQRAQQWTLILDWAALPSASRRCWESMARLQDPCAHTGEKWTARERGGKSERARERDIVPELSCLCRVFLSFSHSLTSTTEEQERWEPARRTCEWRSLGHLVSSIKTQVSLGSTPSRCSQE